MRRAKEKKQQVQESVQHNQGNEKYEHDAVGDITLVDQFTPYLVIRTSGKVRSFDFGPGDGGMKGGTQAQKLNLFPYAVLTSIYSFALP